MTIHIIPSVCACVCVCMCASPSANRLAHLSRLRWSLVVFLDAVAAIPFLFSLCGTPPLVSGEGGVERDEAGGPWRRSRGNEVGGRH